MIRRMFRLMSHNNMHQDPAYQVDPVGIEVEFKRDYGRMSKQNITAEAIIVIDTKPGSVAISEAHDGVPLALFTRLSMSMDSPCPFCISNLKIQGVPRQV
jgi:hypothetical protein